MSNLDSMTKLAFMLKKCTNPEVKDFGSRLDYESADFVKKVFENKNNRDKILAIIRDHYDLDTVQVEADIVELYTRSIQIEIDMVNSAITETKITVDSMLFTIAQVKSKNDELQSELDNIMSMSSGAGLVKIQEQLKSVKHFKDKICNMFEEAKNALPYETSASTRMVVIQLKDKYGATRSEEKKPPPPPQKPEKKKKDIAASAQKKGISDEEFDIALQEAKASAEPNTPEQEFRGLFFRHEAVINSIQSPGIIFKTSNPDAFQLITQHAVMTNLLSTGITNESARTAFFAFVDFYIAMIQRYNADPSPNKADLANRLTAFGAPPGHKTVRMTSMLDFIKACLVLNESSFTEQALKKATNFVKNYIDSPKQDISLLTKSTFDIVASLKRPVESCVALIATAAYSELKQRLMISKRNAKTMALLHHLVTLIAKCSCVKYYNSLEDSLAADFVHELIHVSYEHEKTKRAISEVYCEEFIVAATKSLSEIDGNKQGYRLFLFIEHAITKTIDSLFQSKVYSQTKDVIAYATKIYAELGMAVEGPYRILHVCTPILTLNERSPLEFNISADDKILASSLFQLTKGSDKEVDLKEIVATLKVTVIKISKRLESEGDYTHAKRLEMIAVCLKVFSDNFDLVYQPNFHKRYKDKLLENSDFIFMFNAISALAISNDLISSIVPSLKLTLQQSNSIAREFKQELAKNLHDAMNLAKNHKEKQDQQPDSAHTNSSAASKIVSHAYNQASLPTVKTEPSTRVTETCKL
jgi:acyl-CoA hydrolase